MYAVPLYISNTFEKWHRADEPLNKNYYVRRN
jgi:hypothetical protein